jgi:multiple sugar transport system substrate-binding protein
MVGMVGMVGGAEWARTRRRQVLEAGAAGTAVLAGALAAACGLPGSQGAAPPAPPAPPPASLEVWDFHDQWNEAFTQVAALYHTRTPTATVTYPPLGNANYFQKVVVALTSGAGPDLMSVNWDFVRMWSTQGFLHDLTTEAARDRAFAQDLAAYHPKLAANMKWDNKQWGVGLDHDCISIFWNMDLFNQAQVPPLTDVQDKWTWNDVIDIARKLTKPEIQQYGFHAHVLTGQVGWWSFVYANGGQVVTEDFTKADPMLDAPSLDAIQWLADAHLKQGVAPGPDQINAAVGTTSYRDMFVKGKLAMMTEGSWQVNAYTPNVAQFQWDVAHMPLAPRTGKRASILHGTGFAVNQAGASLDASVAYGKFLGTRDVHKIYGSTGIIQSARMDEWDGFYANPKPPAHRQTLKAVLDYAQPYLAPGQWGIQSPDAFAPFTKALTSIYAGQVAVKDGVLGAVRDYDALLADQVSKSAPKK